VLLFDLLSFATAAAYLWFTRKRREASSSYTGWLIWQQSILAGAAIVTGALFSGLVALNSDLYQAHSLSSKPIMFIYGLLGLGALLGMRSFLIEYVGDLAAYLSAHEASKFSEIRAQIQRQGFRTACHVYDSGYANVIIVGHSLGSVIAYDTLNGLISHDYIKGKKWRSVERTKLLLTFGSPLDKTAFIFRAQVKDNVTREVLAAGKQPMLQENHFYRPRFWVNVWSPNDVISGALEFYDRGELEPKKKVAGLPPYEFTYKADAPDGETDAVPHCALLPSTQEPLPKTSPVVSLIDPKADIPFAAHTQFWDNQIIYDVLTKALQDDGSGREFEKFLSVNGAQKQAAPAAPRKRRPPAKEKVEK
jgi:hypothetical protein